jgi:hypothetical protein
MEREERFVNLVQLVLTYFMIHGGPDFKNQKPPDLFDYIHCLDDAYFYARNHTSKIMTMGLASHAQYFVGQWMRGDPECKRA